MANFLFKNKMNRRLFTITLLLLSGLILTYFNIANATSLSDRLGGYILLQVQSHGEAWYVIPTEAKRTYLADGPAAYNAMSKLGLGITNTNLKKIPVGIDSRIVDIDSDGDGLGDKLEEGLKTSPNNIDSDGDSYSDYQEVINDYSPLGKEKNVYDQALINRLKGRILLQVEEKGQAWYINPVNGHRYYMKDGPSAYEIMRFLSLGITNDNLNQIPVSSFSAGVPTTPSVVIDTQAPTAPANLTAIATSTQITLNWSISTDNVGVKEYQVERSNSATAGFVFITLVNSNSYINANLTANTTYYYRVRAVDAAGNFSSYSSISSARTGAAPVADTQAPTVPTNLLATASSTQITLTWTRSTDNVAVTQYRLERSNSATSGFTSLTTVATNSYVNTGLNASTRYYYRVRAADAAGNLSNYSSIVNAITGTGTTPPLPTNDTQEPTAPSNLTATSTSAQVTLNWSASSDNTAVTGYKVMRSNTNGSAYALVSNVNATTCVDSNLNAGTYYYVVAAYDAIGNVSANSSQVQIVVVGATPPVQYISIAQPYSDKIVVANIEAPENTAYTWYKNSNQVESGTSATTFLAHFDASLNTVSNEAPLAQTGVSYVDTKFGKGMKGKAEYPVPSNLNFNEGTIEFWLTLNNSLSDNVYNTDQYIFKYINSSNFQKIMMNIKTDLPALVFTVHSGSTDADWSDAVQINTLYNDTPANEPMFFSMTYSKSENKSSLYLNGFKISQDDFLGFNFGSANSNLIIGNNNAIIDEFRILNKALTAEEVMSNYTRGVSFGANEIYYSGIKSINDNLQLNINLGNTNHAANSVVKIGKISSISPSGYVLSNRSSINLSFNSVSAATCRYGKQADNYSDLPYAVNGTGTSHSINYAVTSVVLSHDFYIKCQNGADGDDYAWYQRMRVLPNINNNYPKLATYISGNAMNSTQVASYAKYDYIFPSNNNLNRPSLLRQIREINPNILLIMYQNATVNKLYGVSDIDSSDLGEVLQDAWRLKNSAGQYADNLYFANTLIYNLNPVVPFADALSTFLKNKVINRGDWDGIGFDVAETNFWWLYDYGRSSFTQPMDYDLDGVDEDLNNSATFARVRTLWGNGLQNLLQLTRNKLGQDVILLGNNADMNHGLYNGKLWESMLNRSSMWNLDYFLTASNSDSYQYWQTNSRSPHLSMNIYRMYQPNNYSYHRYGMIASLLGGVYYTPTDSDSTTPYGNILWYDEFWVDWATGKSTSDASKGRGYLGQPVSPVYSVSPNIWRRDFQHGIAILNNTAITATVDLGDEFRYIEGEQDKVANSGGVTRSVVLSAHDARVLLTTTKNDPLVGL
jgi:chitodextrinase